MSQFRFGNFDFPDKYIKYGAVNVKPNQRQSIDAYTDAFGLTHDNGVPHTKTEVSFTTLKMSGDAFRVIMDGIARNYTDYILRDANCTYYDDESGSFKSGHFYFDKSFQVNREKVGESGVPVKYGEMTWTFIEY